MSDVEITQNETYPVIIKSVSPGWGGNEHINEALRQLNLPDGDEDTEHPDTQYSDFDSAGAATITFLPGLTADDLDYWYNRAQEISNEFFQGLPVTFVPKA